RTVIPLWRYAAIAASVIGFVFAFQIWDNSGGIVDPTITAFDSLDDRYTDENYRSTSSGQQFTGTNSGENQWSNDGNNSIIKPLNQGNPSIGQKSDNFQFAHLEKRTPEINHHQQYDDIRIVEHPLHPVNQSALEEPVIA